jgi:hypothetical protein
MQYVQWQTEVAARQSDQRYAEEVKRIESQGCMVITSDMQWTGLYNETGQPILLKVLGYGTDKERQEVYGPNITVPPSLYRKRDLTVKMQTEDLTLHELNELKRLGG